MSDKEKQQILTFRKLGPLNIGQNYKITLPDMGLKCMN